MRGGFGSASTLTVSDAAGDPARGDRPSAQVSYLIRQSGQVQYGNQNWTHQHPGRQPQLSADDQLAHRRRARDLDRGRRRGAALVVVIGQTV